MIKYLILAVLLFSNTALSQVYVFGMIPNEFHDSLVVESFKLGYGPSWNGTIAKGTKSISQAVSEGYTLYIKSYSDFQYQLSTASSNYDSILVVMPSGLNTHTQIYNPSALPELVLTGCGTTSNLSSYPTEFFDPNPFNVTIVASYSNGFIAGQLMHIKDSVNCSWHVARLRARATASLADSFTMENGYGRINKIDAINYEGTIIDLPEPYAPPLDADLPEWYKPPSPD